MVNCKKVVPEHVHAQGQQGGSQTMRSLLVASHTLVAEYCLCTSVGADGINVCTLVDRALTMRL